MASPVTTESPQMANVSGNSTGESYELLVADSCPAGLPVNPVRDEYTIARFVELSIKPASGGNEQKAVIPRDVVMPEALEAYARAYPSATVTDMKGGIALVEEWNRPTLPATVPKEPPLARPVVVRNVDQLIATRLVEIDGRRAKVELDRAAMASLLKIGHAVVWVETADGRALVSITTSVAPTKSNGDGRAISVSDLSSFLEQPLIVTPDGTAQEVSLSAENVAELRATGTTRAMVGASSQAVSITATGLEARQSGTIGTVYEGEPAMPVFEAVMPQEPWDIASFASRLAKALPAFELALYLPFRQEWELLGYSRGALLNSLSLAPQEETTIEIFSWDRRKQSSERSTTTELEVTSDTTVTTKDSDEVLKEVTRDSSFQLQARGELSVAPIGLTIGSSLDAKTAVKDLTKQTHNHIQDSVTKTSGKVKASRQTKISESFELGREERVTRKIRNPNMCHTLSLDYFEILSNYNVRTRFDAAAARLCVLLQNPVDFDVDRTSLRVYDHVLRPGLLAPALASGFDAARLLAARERACSVACEQCDCTPVATDGSGDANASAAWQAVVKALERFASPWVNSLCTATPDDFYAASYSVTPPPLGGKVLGGEKFESARENYQRWLYVQALRETGAGDFVRLMCSLVSDRGQASSKTFAEDFWWHIERLSDEVLDADHLRDTLSERLWKVTVEPSSAAWAFAHTGLNYPPSWVLRDYGMEHFEDSGLPSAVARFKTAYKAYVAALNAAGAANEKAAAAAIARDNSATDAIGETYALREVIEAQEREDALIRHISVNKPYYRYTIWRSLDAAAQRSRLPSAVTSGRLISPEAVGFYGDRLAFPVTVTAHEQLKKWFLENVSANSEITTLSGERRATLPTPGIAMESRLGQCDACEDYIREQRKSELRTRAAQASKEEHEAERYQQRLKQQPPLLDDPHQPEGPIRIELEQRPRVP
jgi:hypothetical protein